MADNKAHQRWIAQNTTRIVMNLNHNTDRDILQKLDSVPSKQGYIKSLIRSDIAMPKTETGGLTLPAVDTPHG